MSLNLNSKRSLLHTFDYKMQELNNVIANLKNDDEANCSFRFTLLKKLLMFVFAFIFQLNVFAQNAREISEKARDVMDIESMEMTATLKILDSKGRERIRQTTTATKKFGEETKTIIKFISPADVKGTTMLIYDYDDKDDDMWIYMPALRKTRRIVSSEKSKNFMGSEFSNADMSAPNLDNFIFNLIGSVTLAGKDCWKVESVSKDEDIEDLYGFSKKISFIEKSTFLVQKVEYYDIDLELFKIMTISKYKKQDNGKYFAFAMKMENVQNGRKSLMEINKFQLGSALGGNYFTPAMIEK